MKNMVIMKMRFIGLVMASAVALAACGKENTDISKEDQEIIDAIEDDLTEEDKEILNEIADELNEETAEDNSNYAATQPEEKKEYSKNFEPLPEIINASFGDMKVQVGKDMIFEYYSMTFDDVDKIIKESSEAERYSWEEYDKYVPESEAAILMLDGERYLVFAFKNLADYKNPKVTINQCRLVQVSTQFLPGEYFLPGGVCSDGTYQGEKLNMDNIETVFKGFEEDTKTNVSVLAPNKIEVNSWASETVDNTVYYFLNALTNYYGVGYREKSYPFTRIYKFAIDLSDGNVKYVSDSTCRTEKTFEQLGLEIGDRINISSLDKEAISEDGDKESMASSDASTSDGTELNTDASAKDEAKAQDSNYCKDIHGTYGYEQGFFVDLNTLQDLGDCYQMEMYVTWNFTGDSTARKDIIRVEKNAPATLFSLDTIKSGFWTGGTNTTFGQVVSEHQGGKIWMTDVSTGENGYITGITTITVSG